MLFSEPAVCFSSGDSVEETEMDIDQKHHIHFLAKQREVLHQLEEEYSGVVISFPRSGVKSTKVTIKGPPDLVEPVKERMSEIVRDLEERITVEVEIPRCLHRSIMGPKGSKVQNIENMFDVKIKFPKKGSGSGSDNTIEEGMVNRGPRKCDLIRVTGKPENVAQAEQALKKYITVEVDVPYDYRGLIIGKKGQSIRDMMDRYDVNIEVPNPDKLQNSIKITGVPEAVEEAKDGLVERLQELECEREDRALRSHRVTIEVDPEYHPKIIGRRGSVISKIKEAHSVKFVFPKRGDPDERTITVIGYEANAEAALKEIEAIVSQLNGRAKEVEIDCIVHSRFIGHRRRCIRRLMDKCQVEIRIPDSDDPDPNLVVISGDKKRVLDARAKLLSLEEEYIERAKKVEIVCTVPSHFIGSKRKNIRKFMEEYQVKIKLPHSGDPNTYLVVITGDEQRVQDAKAKLLSLEEEYIERAKEEVEINCRVHSDFIGFRRKSIRKLMDKCKVKIMLPCSGDPNLIVIYGDEQRVLDARAKLLSLEDEYLDDVMKMEPYQSRKSKVEDPVS